MKKVVWFICILFVMILCLCSCNSDSSVWKDTHKVLGDGTYQIFNHKNNGVDIKGISNSKCHQCIVDEIIATEERAEKLYVYGTFTEHEVYVVIDLNNNKSKYFVVIEPDDVLGMTNINDMINSGTFELLENYNDFDETERVVFEQLVNTLSSQ